MAAGYPERERTPMQTSFADLEYAAKKKVTRRDRFLAEIKAVTPWATLEAEIEAFYPKGAHAAGVRGDQRASGRTRAAAALW